MARYCDPDANVQSGERFAEQSMLNTPLPRLSTDSIGGLSSPTVNWNHRRLRLQYLVFCGANACSDRKVMQLAGLCSPSELKRDEGVSERLKDICTGMGFDIRGQLVLGGFDETAHRLNLHRMTDALVKAIPTRVNECEVIAEALEHTNTMLPEGRDCDDVALEASHATVRFLAYLWESNGKAAVSTARQVPLVASNRRAVRWSSDRPFMAPVCAWPEAARPFVNAYPPNRVLDNLYACSEIEEVPSVVNAFVGWGMAYADPVIDNTVELRDRRLATLSPSADTNGIVVPPEQLSQIALLQPEVLNRCQEGIDEARALLGLVLCYVASACQKIDIYLNPKNKWRFKIAKNFHVR